MAGKIECCVHLPGSGEIFLLKLECFQTLHVETVPGDYFVKVVIQGQKKVTELLKQNSPFSNSLEYIIPAHIIPAPIIPAPIVPFYSSRSFSHLYALSLVESGKLHIMLLELWTMWYVTIS